MFGNNPLVILSLISHNIDTHNAAEKGGERNGEGVYYIGELWGG
jgi:hypothetical protein